GVSAMRKYQSASIITAFALLGLTLALAVVDRLNPIGRTRADDRSVVITAADGTLLRTFISQDGKWRLPVDPQNVDGRHLRMALAWADQRFREHPGVDPMAMLRAMYQMAVEARVVSGGSTITMQVARLMEPRERTLPAKLLQIARAVQLDWHLTKDEILEL